MKLKKILPYMPFMADVELYNEKDECIWCGDMVNLKAAADSEEKRKQYLKECRQDKDLSAIAEVETAMPYVNYHLDDSNIDWEAIDIRIDEGVRFPTILFNLKKEK